MGCINDKPGNQNRKKTFQTKFSNSKHPIIKIAKQWNFQIIKQRWVDNELDILTSKLGPQTKAISFPQFLQLLPSLNNFSEESQHHLYELFNFEQQKQIGIQKFIITQIIILKSDDYELLADMFFYSYSSAKQKTTLDQKDFRLFQKQFKEHQLDFQHAKKRPQKNANGEISISKKMFREVFEQYDMKTIKMLFKFDLKDEQRRFQRFLVNNNIDRCHDNQVFLIEFRWFLTWKNYMEFKYGIQIQIKQNHKELSLEKNTQLQGIMKQNEKIIKLSRKLADESREEGTTLQPINNQIIKGEEQNELKENLIEFQNFISVPKQCWRQFRLLYGGGPTIYKPYPHFYNKKIVLVSFNHQKAEFQNNFAKSIHYVPNQSFQQILQKRKDTYFKKQQSKDMIVYYKFPGKLQWTKIQNLSHKLQGYPFHFKTFLVYVRRNSARSFEDRFNVTIFKQKKQFKQRIKNFGNLLSFEHEGVVQQGHVGNVFNNSVILYLKNQSGQYVKIQKICKQLEKENPPIFQQHIVQGLAGLQNTGNSCYINAPIQCLLRAPIFSEYLESINLGKNKKDLLTYQLQQIFDQSKKSRDCMEMMAFKKKFDQKFPFFQGSAQHDAQQFLILLLDKISQQIPERSSISHQTQPQPQLSTIKPIKNKKTLKFFSGTIESSTQCQKCHNVGKSQQTFFTYSLSLPIINQVVFTFYFIDDAFKVWKYCLTVDKQSDVGDIVKEIEAELKLGGKNLLVMSVFQKQWMNNVLKMNPSHKMTAFESYQTSVVCYQVQNYQMPDYEDFKSSTKSNSVKLQIRNRIYDDKLKQFKSFHFPFYIEVDCQKTGQQLISVINTKFERYINEQETMRFQNTYEQKSDDKQPESYPVFISGDNNIKEPLNVKNNISSSEKVPKKQKRTTKSPFTIRFLKKQGNMNSICWFCKKNIDRIIDQKDRGNYCSGCEFEQNEKIYENKVFIKNWQNLVISVDWNSQTLTKNFQIFETKSCEVADKLQKQRRVHIDKLLKQSTQQEQKIELRCEKQQCKHNEAIRRQIIRQAPNILILHIKRFEYRKNTFYKLKNKVDIPEQLTLSGQAQPYELYGNVVHYGSGTGRGGHYINYVKVNQNWFRCDDQKVHFTKRDKEHLNPDAYLLFYKKRQNKKNMAFLNF